MAAEAAILGMNKSSLEAAHGTEESRTGQGRSKSTRADTQAALDLRRLSRSAADALSTSSQVRVECAITFTKAGCHPITAASEDRAEALALSEYLFEKGPLQQAMHNGKPVVVRATGGDPTWQPFRCRFTDAGYEGVLVVPVWVGAHTACTVAFFGPVGFCMDSEQIKDAAHVAGLAGHSLERVLT